MQSHTATSNWTMEVFIKEFSSFNLLNLLSNDLNERTVYQKGINLAGSEDSLRAAYKQVWKVINQLFLPKFVILSDK